MKHYLQHSLAPSTRTSYNSATRSFTSFALTYHRLGPDGALLPATEETLMLYATYLSYTLKPQSIKVYLSAIRTWHIEHGLPSPTEDAPQLQALLRGIKRLHGCPADSRLPITPSLLRSFRLFLNLSYPDHLTLWGAMLVAFFGFLRSNELLALTRSDLSRTEEGYDVSIRHSKTDPFRAGAVIRLRPTGDGTLCPVVTLDHLLRQLPPGPAQPVLQLQGGPKLSRSKLNSLIRDLASRSGIPPGRYSTHSFRIGAATTAAAAGIPEWKIQALGRWASSCYVRYIRLPASETDTVAATLAQMRL